MSTGTTRKNLTITVINSRGKRKRIFYRAPAKHRFTSEGIDALLAKTEEEIRQHSPNAEYRLVPLRNGNFNIIEIVADAISEIQA